MDISEQGFKNHYRRASKFTRSREVKARNMSLFHLINSV